MSVLDLKTELIRMLEERRGVSDDTLENRDHKDLDTLKSSLQDMLDVRSGKIKLSVRSCPDHVGTICQEHEYKTYADITRATTKENALSVLDIDAALSRLTYCTCEGRQAGGCLCQNNYMKDYCLCMGRTTVLCACQNRDGGKYGARCNCNLREVTLCSCQGRTSTLNCTCEGRCSCNVQKMFSHTKPDDRCACNTKVVPGCICNLQKMGECTYFIAAGKVSDCPANWNYPHQEITTCVCMSRCSCNAKAVMK